MAVHNLLAWRHHEGYRSVCESSGHVTVTFIVADFGIVALGDSVAISVVRILEASAETIATKAV